LTLGLLKQDNVETIALTRKASEKAQRLAAAGATLRVVADLSDEACVVEALRGVDTLVVATAASEEIVTKLEPLWLAAAVKAGVTRFVPTEFGCHTVSIELGDGELFDIKKAMHERIFAAGIGYTFVFAGGFHDYFLPNTRFFDAITTFGDDMEHEIYTHAIADIGAVAALAVTDARTLNHCVQIDYKSISQRRMLELVREHWQAEPLVYTHYSSAWLTREKSRAGNTVSAKAGSETDAQRAGINYVIYVLHKLVGFGPTTLRASKLWPEFVAKTPESAICDPKFFLDSSA
jgi:hypothetical protein